MSIEPVQSSFPQLTTRGQPVFNDLEPFGRNLVRPHPPATNGAEQRPVRVIRKLGLFLLLVATAAVLAGLYGAPHDQHSYTVAPEYYTRFKFEQFAFACVGTMPPRPFFAVGMMHNGRYLGGAIGVLVAVGLQFRAAREARRRARAEAVVTRSAG